MRILYAASDRFGASKQASVLYNILKNNYNVSVVGYSNTTDHLITEYNLDVLLNFAERNSKPVTNTKNYKQYLQLIKSMRPDLIISDLEIYTSVAALELNIPLWQYSPVLLYYALDKRIKDKLNIYNQHSHLFNENYDIKEYYNYIIANSDKNFIPTFLSDYDHKLHLKNNFILTRPYYNILENTSEGYGDTQTISDAFYSGMDHFASQISEIESLLNLQLGKLLGLFQMMDNQKYQLVKHCSSVNENIQFLLTHIKNYENDVIKR